MTAQAMSPPGQAELEAARLLLARMGIAPADLLSVAQARPPAPTFAEYIPVVSAAVSGGARRVYGSYWKRICDQWGPRRLDESSPSDIERLADYIRTHTVARRNARGGRSATEHLIAALRCLYHHAVADGLLAEADNPARKVAKPRRLPSTRRAVADARLAEINQVAAGTGNDPALDSLLLRLHTETACRRGGALALRLAALCPDQCLILLREKGGTVRWQPVSPTRCPPAAARSRPSGPTERTAPALPQRSTDHHPPLRPPLGAHRPTSALGRRPADQHPLAAAPTLTWVERTFGYAVARAYAGHADSGSDTGTTTTYIRASIQEVAAALSALTDEPHPLV